jgi:hypothetical protein
VRLVTELVDGWIPGTSPGMTDVTAEGWVGRMLEIKDLHVKIAT